jgi:intergrase/recombinase
VQANTFFLPGTTSLKERMPFNPINDVKLTLDWSDLTRWVNSKYAKTYSPTILCYIKKYGYLINGNLKELDYLTDSTKATVVKALIILSKFLGLHQQFKQRLLDYGIKIHRQDSFTSFLRILNTNTNSTDILKWINEVKPILNDSENTFLRFCLYSGLRKSEALLSFNRIIELNNKGLLNEYYDANLNCLKHFVYPKDCIRKTKNCFITFITEDLLKQICNSKPVSYNAMRKKLERKNIKMRINELRDYYGTYLLNHGILEAEINLMQGRIPPSIFIKHYWSPKLSELSNRILSILKDLEKQ